MALRKRIPNRKQLGGGARRRNKNPKLSPFQREQKRDRLANQPPIATTTRDHPASARNLFQYLSERAERLSHRREKRARQPEDDSSSPKAPRSVAGAVVEQPHPPAPAAAADKAPLNAVTSLNAMAKPDLAAEEHNAAILRRKGRRLMKKKERRIARAVQWRESLVTLAAPQPAEVQESTEDRPQTARQKRTKSNQLAEPTVSGATPSNGSTQRKKRARVPEEPVLDEELDIVRFGDRVDAPPVFEVIPKASRGARVTDATSLELSERKRLQKLGLLPSIGLEHTTGTSRSTSSEFDRYREEVLERYARSRKPDPFHSFRQLQ